MSNTAHRKSTAIFVSNKKKSVKTNNNETKMLVVDTAFIPH